MGLFNPSATVSADVNLLLQLVILVVLLVGWTFKRNYLRHGMIMGALVALNTLLIFLVMAPSLWASTGLFTNTLSQLALVIALHSALGSIVEVGGIYLLIVWVSNHGLSKTCFKNRTIMKATIIAWIIELVLGMYLYALLYLPR